MKGVAAWWRRLPGAQTKRQRDPFTTFLFVPPRCHLIVLPFSLRRTEFPFPPPPRLGFDLGPESHTTTPHILIQFSRRRGPRCACALAPPTPILTALLPHWRFLIEHVCCRRALYIRGLLETAGGAGRGRGCGPRRGDIYCVLARQTRADATLY